MSIPPSGRDTRAARAEPAAKQTNWHAAYNGRMARGADREGGRHNCDSRELSLILPAFRPLRFYLCFKCQCIKRGGDIATPRGRRHDARGLLCALGNPCKQRGEGMRIYEKK